MQASKEIGISITDILCCKYWFYGHFIMQNSAREMAVMFLCPRGEIMDSVYPERRNFLQDRLGRVSE